MSLIMSYLFSMKFMQVSISCFWVDPCDNVSSTHSDMKSFASQTL